MTYFPNSRMEWGISGDKLTPRDWAGKSITSDMPKPEVKRNKGSDKHLGTFFALNSHFSLTS